MKAFLQNLIIATTIVLHFIVLVFVVAKTGIKRAYRSVMKIEIFCPHLCAFITRRKTTGCNLTSLTDALNEIQNDTLQVANIIDALSSYETKEDLLFLLPEREMDTEIIALPFAASSPFLLYVRHFVTIIIDFRDRRIEFYDSLGYTSKQYGASTIWGPNCEKGSCLTVEELVSACQSFYGFDDLVENDKFHQRDFNQCALFVFDRIYKRSIKGYTFEKAQESPLTPKQAFI